MNLGTFCFTLGQLLGLFQMISRILQILFSTLGMPRKRIVFQCLRSTRSTRKLKPNSGFLKFLSANKILQNPYKNMLLENIIKISCIPWSYHRVYLAGTWVYFVRHSESIILYLVVVPLEKDERVSRPSLGSVVFHINHRLSSPPLANIQFSSLFCTTDTSC